MVVLGRVASGVLLRRQKRGPEIAKMPQVERREASVPIARGAPRLARAVVSKVRLAALRSPGLAGGMKGNEAQPARHDKRAAERWLVTFPRNA